MSSASMPTSAIIRLAAPRTGQHEDACRVAFTERLLQDRLAEGQPDGADLLAGLEHDLAPRRQRHDQVAGAAGCLVRVEEADLGDPEADGRRRTPDDEPALEIAGRRPDPGRERQADPRR
jgi:hypothetical protein